MAKAAGGEKSIWGDGRMCASWEMQRTHTERSHQWLAWVFDFFFPLTKKERKKGRRESRAEHWGRNAPVSRSPGYARAATASDSASGRHSQSSAGQGDRDPVWKRSNRVFTRAFLLDHHRHLRKRPKKKKEKEEKTKRKRTFLLNTLLQSMMYNWNMSDFIPV